MRPGRAIVAAVMANEPDPALGVAPAIALFTDYGWRDPYVGQVKAVLARQAPGVPVIDLLHEIPDFNAHAGAHLIAALVSALTPGSVVFAVVDPGVGGPRDAVVMQAEDRWFVGPDNGLLSVLAARATAPRFWRIDWRPDPADVVSFDGRDLFAPIAARLAIGDFPRDLLTPISALTVQFDASDLARVIFIDHYGNAWTGIRAGLAGPDDRLRVKGHELGWRRVFHEAGKGEAFWYGNSVGLLEIAANRASAAGLLGIEVGDRVGVAGPRLGDPH